MRNNITIIREQIKRGREKALTKESTSEMVTKTFTAEDNALSLPRCFIINALLTPLLVDSLPDKLFGVNVRIVSSKEEIRRGFNVARSTVEVPLGISTDQCVLYVDTVAPLTSIALTVNIAR